MVEEQVEMTNFAHELHHFLTAEAMDQVRTLLANRQASINMEFGTTASEELVENHAAWVVP